MSQAGPPAARRILIVDDAEEARQILAIALGTITGTTIATADSAEEALSGICQSPPDVLITDFRMSGMSGLELLATVRERGCWPRCGAIVISGEADPDLPTQAVQSGAAAFFSKPFSAGAVRQSVISLLEAHYGVG